MRARRTMRIHCSERRNAAVPEHLPTEKKQFTGVSLTERSQTEWFQSLNGFSQRKFLVQHGRRRKAPLIERLCVDTHPPGNNLMKL